MDPHTLELLELPKILSQLESVCASELGRSRVARLKPAKHRGEVARRLNETSQAKQFLESAQSVPFGGISDISRLLKNAQIGSMLAADELAAVGKLLSGSRVLKSSIEKESQEENAENNSYSLLLHHTKRISVHAELEQVLSSAIDFTTQSLKDNASLRLLKARRGIARAQADIQGKMRTMLTDPRIQPHLKDSFITLREGRYCLPVRAESRNAVPGIVHDRSGSGGAFFIEPQAIVELNNRLRELTLEEREAVHEVLQNLTHQVGEKTSELKSTLAACSALDFSFAKARLSLAMDAHSPALGTGGFHLVAARHPLIEKCVSNDIRLGQEFDTLMLTGPNTGGKTVVLKTLGLSVLMAMCGLHICADPESTLCLPKQIFADIGDEQSIEQSLSTFSSHMTRIIRILKEAQKGDLVLFDEIGAGTDPDEGAALAKAILRTLSRRGVLLVATTHYGELKQFALGAERFQNASVEFDALTLQPTYRLRIGVPGASNAIAIASRLGLPPELAQRARRYLGKAREETELATQKLEETQKELQEQTEGVLQERAEAARLQTEFDTKLQVLQEERERELAAARHEAAHIVRQAQDEANTILKELRRAAKESKETEIARRRLKTLREKTTALQTQTAETQIASRQTTSRKEVKKKAAATPKVSQRAPLKVGEFVRVASFNKEGELLALIEGGQKAAVRIGAMRIEVPISELTSAPSTSHRSAPAAPAFSGRIFATPEEINLIGKRTDEAILELEEYLDNAILSNAKSVRIIHGRGTGALRRAVHEYLKNTRTVSSFELAPANEGGEGATVVKFI